MHVQDRKRTSFSYLRGVAGMVGLTAIVSACTTPPQPQEIVSIKGTPMLQTLDCPTSSPRVCVDIVFIPFSIKSKSVLCPVYTLTQDGQLNGIPEMSKKVKKQAMLWRAVDVAGNHIENVTFYIYFDPFKGKKESKKGAFTSGFLEAPPEKVQFKYTITAADGCPPLDPMIRIAN